MKRFLLSLVLPLVTAVFVSSATATPITSIEGTINSFIQVQSVGASGAIGNTVSLNIQGELTKINGQPTTALFLIFSMPNPPDNLMTITDVTATDTLTTYALSPVEFDKNHRGLLEVSRTAARRRTESETRRLSG